MKGLFRSMLIAVSTYSAVPVPSFDWREEDMKYCLCFFPVVGILIAAAQLLLLGLFRTCSLSPDVASAFAVCIPVLITGGIHLDGFMDTVDAVSSHQSRERKLEILKDTHNGAFAVIYCGMYFLVSYALMKRVISADFRTAAALTAGYVVSRALSGISVTCLPNARGSGMLASFTGNMNKKSLFPFILSAAAGLSIAVVLSPVCGGMFTAASVLMYFLYRRFAMKVFGGVTGDTSGFFLVMTELVFLASAALASGFQI